MPILRNKTQQNFTMISNLIFRDKELSLKDLGLLCFLMSLPDSWNFSIAGLAAIRADGKDSIRTSLNSLQKLGYIKKYQVRNELGQFETIVEISPERSYHEGNDNGGLTASGNPTRVDQHGETTAEKLAEYNNKHYKNTANTDMKDGITTNDVVVTANEIFKEFNLPPKSIRAILNASNNNIDKCLKALKLLKQQTKPINNIAGWLIDAIKEDYQLSRYDGYHLFHSENLKTNESALNNIEHLYMEEVRKSCTCT